MSTLRKRFLLAEDNKEVDPNAQPAQPADPNAQPAQGEPAAQPAAQPEAPAQPADTGESQGVLKDYPDGYTNQWGKVTPYHILFKSFGTEISNMTGPQAVDFCLEKINEFKTKYNGDTDYTNPSPDAVAKFKRAVSKARTGMDVMFKLKDFLLASEGQAVVATLEDAFANPKIAKAVASVFNTLIAAHEGLKKKK